MKMRKMKNYFFGKLVRLTVFFCKTAASFSFGLINSEKSKEIKIEEIQRNWNQNDKKTACKFLICRNINGFVTYYIRTVILRTVKWNQLLTSVFSYGLETLMKLKYYSQFHYEMVNGSLNYITLWLLWLYSKSLGWRMITLSPVKGIFLFSSNFFF